eukprot:CAMPEP_0114604292 /NCGR_PEP_ID=MMETSP0168-20121206/471_1 /TAXON_ID=95228 ORGANISM="Vannella sp., Strain DIVA3 517/6/12" /NCGR_SAMPLE_ID=MMETSP0168 /ASSEMBLY_ACC=CAM_ASM_000044 /LENGTH=114 /DNA_ID=CAMNT_0001815121 /DNA_START=23 /DNA_END=367 /DNA_ORIENTATION=-
MTSQSQRPQQSEVSNRRRQWSSRPAQVQRAQTSELTDGCWHFLWAPIELLEAAEHRDISVGTPQSPERPEVLQWAKDARDMEAMVEVESVQGSALCDLLWDLNAEVCPPIESLQ